MIRGWSKKSLMIVSICSCFVLSPRGAAFAREKAPDVPDPVEAQKMVTDEQHALDEQLPVEESGHDGYWWNKQDKNEKPAYVKELIVKFKLTDKKLSVKKIAAALDREYDPRDNPLDIKMDKSVERIFNGIIKEMKLK